MCDVFKIRLFKLKGENFVVFVIVVYKGGVYKILIFVYIV